MNEGQGHGVGRVEDPVLPRGFASGFCPCRQRKKTLLLAVDRACPESGTGGPGWEGRVLCVLGCGWLPQGQRRLSAASGYSGWAGPLCLLSLPRLSEGCHLTILGSATDTGAHISGIINPPFSLPSCHSSLSVLPPAWDLPSQLLSLVSRGAGAQSGTGAHGAGGLAGMLSVLAAGSSDTSVPWYLSLVEGQGGEVPVGTHREEGGAGGGVSCLLGSLLVLAAAVAPLCLPSMAFGLCSQG